MKRLITALFAALLVILLVPSGASAAGGTPPKTAPKLTVIQMWWYPDSTHAVLDVHAYNAAGGMAAVSTVTFFDGQGAAVQAPNVVTAKFGPGMGCAQAGAESTPLLLPGSAVSTVVTTTLYRKLGGEVLDRQTTGKVLLTVSGERVPGSGQLLWQLLPSPGC